MTFHEYHGECSQRWYGDALADALHNWRRWKEMHDYLTEAMRQYLRNPFQRDMGDRCFNPNGTLRGFLWHCQIALQPDRSRLDPLLDFEEHYQKIFLKRGLIIYCSDILRSLETRDTSTQQETFFAPTEAQ
jgi:hypothetical protein